MSAPGAIGTLLEEAGHGQFSIDDATRSIWLGGVPATAEVYPAITISMWGGNVIQRFGVADRQPNAQVFVVGQPDLYEATEDFADVVWDTVANSGRFTLDGTAIEALLVQTSPMPLGVDGNNRSMFSFNLEVTYA